MKKSKLDLVKSEKEVRDWFKYAEEKEDERIKQNKIKAEQEHIKYLKESISFSCQINGVMSTVSLKREDLQKLIIDSGVLSEIEQSVSRSDALNRSLL